MEEAKTIEIEKFEQESHLPIYNEHAPGRN